jgi:hypothetical protein
MSSRTRNWTTLVALIASVCVAFLTGPVDAHIPINGARFHLSFSSRSLDTSAVNVNGPPRHSTGLTDAVQWDNYTLWIEGQRIFLQYVCRR